MDENDHIESILDSVLSEGVERSTKIQNLHTVAINGALRDASFTPNHVTSILSILIGSQVLASTSSPPLAAPARSICDISIAVLSYPEVLQSRELRRASSDYLLTSKVIDSILRRIVICSEALSTIAPFALGAKSQKVLPGLVTIATSSSASSSSQSTSYFFSKSLLSAIETNRGRRGPCRGIYQCSSSFLAMRDTADASTAILSTADELAYLRALLFFLHELAGPSLPNDSDGDSADTREADHCASQRNLLMSRCESFLVNVGRDPSPAVSLAVEVVLGFVAARFRGEYERAACCDGETFRYFEKVGSMVKSTNFASESLLHSMLLPLHSMPGMASDTSASLSCFHETLTYCITLILSSESPSPFSSLTAVITRLAELLPSESHDQPQRSHFGSAHALLILHGIDALLKSAEACVPRPNLSASMWLILDKILPFCICDSSREAQKALSFFRIQSFVNFVVTDLNSHQLSRLLIALVFRSKNWNLTVNRMSVAAAKALYTANEQNVLEAVCLCLNLPVSTSSTKSRSIPTPTSTVPPRRSHLSGVISASGAASGWSSASGVQPAVITGVAPWAKPAITATHLPPPPPRLPTTTTQGPLASTSQSMAANVAKDPPSSVISSNKTIQLEEARKRFEEALVELSPPTLQSAGSLVNPTVAAALSRSPVLLPSLAFQDLVFGHELGAGSFSSVRYAKLIRKGLPASQWPEYAIKVISTQTINEMGYELAVRREIAVLSSLTHPNVTRLASAFRWRDGAFLVLEYCSGGDLQKLLSEVGSLSEDAAKFLMAEVCAGIHHIHSMGLTYGDCKPENIVLVGTGTGSARSESVGLHAKITDFAACRPFNSHGYEVFSNARDILKNLRDGDWRAQHGLAEAIGATQTAQVAQPLSQTEPESETNEDSESTEKDDDRLEGTVEYLAPELASKRGQPTIASDAFAFGVTLFKVLTGELPNLEANQASSMSPAIAKVRFEDSGVINSTEPSDLIAPLNIFPQGFPSSASTLITRLLSVNPEERLYPTGDFLSILQHPWFREDNSFFCDKTPDDIMSGDLTNLQAPLVQNGLRGPPPDPAWSRRHNSSMWAPLPKEYTTIESPSSTSMTNIGQSGSALSQTRPRLLDFANAESDAILFKKLRL